MQKLETELANAHLSFKKFDAGSQKIDEIWNAQMTLFDMIGIEYTKKATTFSQTTRKPNFTKAQGKSFISSEAKHAKAVISKKNTTTYACGVPNVETKPTRFVPTCHQCGVKGHIRPHCPRLETKHVHSQFITSHVKPKHPKVVQSPKFNLVCHHCGVFGHIRPYCHKLNRVSSSHAYNQPRNQYERLENQIRVLTMHMNKFIFKPR